MYFFSSKIFFSQTVGGNGLRLFLLYFLGLPNLKIFLNSLFAKSIKLDFVNGMLYINNKPLSIEKAIRKCIEYSFTYGNLDELNKLCLRDISVHTGKINNKKFISKLAQYLK